MKISIVTICYNDAKTIEQTIKSVLSQTYSDIEYIVIDGGSTDGTLDIVEKYRDSIDRFVSEPDDGLFDALNKGTKMASGDVVGLLHADDIFYDKSVVKKVVDAMHAGAQVAWGDIVYVDKGDTDNVVRCWRSSSYSSGKFHFGWMPPHTAFWAKQSLFEECGYYDTSLDMAADYELMLRFIKVCGAKTAYIPHTLTKMRIGGVSDRSFKNLLRIIKTNLNCYRAWRKNDLWGGWLVPAKPMRKIFQRFKSPRE